MTDIFVGLVIISICTGTINGAVYGWLVFGTFVFLFGLFEYTRKLLKENTDVQ